MISYRDVNLLPPLNDSTVEIEQILLKKIDYAKTRLVGTTFVSRNVSYVEPETQPTFEQLINDCPDLTVAKTDIPREYKEQILDRANEESGDDDNIDEMIKKKKAEILGLKQKINTVIKQTILVSCKNHTQEPEQDLFHEISDIQQEHLELIKKISLYSGAKL